MCFFYQETYSQFGYSSPSLYIDKKEFERLSINFIEFNIQTMITKRLNKCSLEIAAPQTDFDISRKLLKNIKS